MILFGILAGLGLAVNAALGAIPLPAHLLPSGGLSVAVDKSVESPASFLDLSDEELLRMVEADPSSLGSLSIGAPGSAVMFNAVALPADPRWETTASSTCWATTETIEAIRAVITKVHDVFAETPPVMIGDISDLDGGRLKRHLSHQGGRDVDFGFYYKTGKCNWFAPGTAATLDLPRNWALIRAIVTGTDVETILLDIRIQKLLYGYALSIGEDKEWLDRVFQFPKGSRSAIISHYRNHQTHYHVRFYNPVAQELGRRVYPMLVQLKKIKPPVFTISHIVREGETLGHLARRYGSSVRAIQQANGLTTTQIRAGRSYRVPMKGVTAPVLKPLVVPTRHLPPRTPDTLASVAWPTPMSLYGNHLTTLTHSLIFLSSAFRRI